MPNAVQADWGLIQQLYMAGQPIATIAEQTGVKQGTIAGRASRARWRAIATKAAQVVKELSSESKAESASESKVSASSERSRAGLARLLERSVERIETMTLRSPKHALKVNQELESVVRNAKTVFGWTENQQAPAIRIGVLAQVTIGSPHPDPKPVIDCPTVTVTEVEPVTDKT